MRGAEFSRELKDKLRKKWHEDNPGNEREQVQLHHQIPKHIGEKLNIPPYFLKSEENALAVTDKEHKWLHENELTLDEYSVLAQALLGISQQDIEIVVFQAKRKYNKKHAKRRKDSTSTRKQKRNKRSRG